MTSTIEISLYPLNNEYPSAVLEFLNQLGTLEAEITTNGMSTIIIGEYDKLWPGLGRLMEKQFAGMDSIFVLKVAPGRREV